MKGDIKIKSGLILILLGFFIPIILFFFASQYEPDSGLLQNIQRMRLVLWNEKIPLFEPVAKKRSMLSGLLDKYTYEEVLVNVGSVTYTFEFPDSMAESERKEILNTKLEGPEPEVIEALNAELAGKERLRFEWKEWPVAVPYKYPLVSGIVLIFLGSVFLVLSIERRRE